MLLNISSLDMDRDVHGLEYSIAPKFGNTYFKSGPIWKATYEILSRAIQTIDY